MQLLSPDKDNLSEDIDANGTITVDSARLYHLLSLDEAVEGTLVITFNDPGMQAFAFTFGS